MSGPQIGFDSTGAVQVAYDNGDVVHGDVVFVTDLSEFVIVLKPNTSNVLFLRPKYPTLESFEADAEEQEFPPWTPGIILNTATPEIPAETVIFDPCGLVSLNASMLPASSNLATGDNSDVASPLDRTSNSGMTTNYNAALLPTVPDL